MTHLYQFARTYISRYWYLYLIGTVALVCTNLLTLEIPQLAKEIVNTLSQLSNRNLNQTTLDKDVTSNLQSLALFIIGLGLLQMIVRSLSRIFIFWPARRMEAVVKSDLFSHLMRLPQEFFERHGMGDLISRMANDLSHIRVFFAFGFLAILNFLFLMAFVISKMVAIHPMLTLFCLLPLLLMLVISGLAMPSLHVASRENQESQGRLTNRVTEAFVNVHVIQSNSSESVFLDRAEEENKNVFLSNLRLLRIETFIWPLITTLTGVSQLVILFYGGREIVAGRLTIGDILVFNVYISYLAFPLTALGIVMGVYLRSKSALRRLREIWTEPAESTFSVSPSPPQTTESLSKPPLLEVKNLNFQYPTENGDSSVLQNISFRLDEGKKIGLFGPIASGKSTLFDLIARIYNPPEGTIFWKGRDILSFEDLREYRKQLGYALQTAFLFSESVEMNLKFGSETDLSSEELSQVADDAQILQEIESLDKKWSTEIGEKGVRLSGGQKQRLAIARIFLRKPTLLLLDDVLSAVDHRTEKKLIRYIHRSKSAMLISSHRGSALKSCDEILILKDGSVQDRGTFQDLVKRHPDLQEDSPGEGGLNE